MKRGSGILLHISSLPGKYGVGTLGKAAYDFVDRLVKAGQSYWQVLPCSPTGYGDSPYQGTSAFAGNPYFIDIDLLLEDGLLSPADIAGITFAEDSSRADYRAHYDHSFSLMQKAYQNGIEKYGHEFNEYKYNNAGWLFDYSLFVVFKRHFGGKQFTLWDKKIVNREPAAVMKLTEMYTQDIAAVQFSQYIYHKQWMELKAYANANGIKIIGDIPIYVSPDSTEAWAHKEMFASDGGMAGCPPDYFCEGGQLWGNPVYDWEHMRAHGYDWWISRIAHCMANYDVTRVDHFRGLESYFVIPKGGVPEDGEWVKGPGYELIDALKRQLGDLPIIAEDLGFLTQEVFDFLAYCGFAGTKVLQFAFGDDNSIYLPHNYPRNCVCYTGTHDNNTTKGWFLELSACAKKRMRDYLGATTAETIADKLMRVAMMSVADISIIPMQDILNLSADARMNYPSKAMGNWKWRMREKEFDSKQVEYLRKMTETYGRL